MITEGQIRKLIDEKLEELELFLVEIKIRPGNNIMVFIDGAKGVTIKECVKISRQIESNLDREIEDFELQVSSAGLDQPFRVLKQYVKNIGKEVTLITKEGEKYSGTLVSAGNEFVEVSVAPTKKELKEKKESQVYKIKFENIKETKSVISFK
jgi:ribosome maturation factor RimP